MHRLVRLKSTWLSNPTFEKLLVRHATHFVRWRPDKPPSDCRYDQLEEKPAAELEALFGSVAKP